MPKFLIEREIPGIGRFSPSEFQAVSKKSNEVLDGLGTNIQWIQSYATDDKLYCVYIAPDAELVAEHARRGGFPANRISQIRAGIDPTTGEPLPR
jgi:Protein of unknown function (DUF4242)